MKTYKETSAKGRFAALVLGILCGVFAYARMDAGHAGFPEFWAVICCIAGLIGSCTNWQRTQ